MAKIPEILIQSNFTRIKIRIISFLFLNINEKLITLILGYKNRFEGYYGNAFFRNICVMFKTVISNTRRYIVVFFFWYFQTRWEDECRSLRIKIRRMEERITALESQNTKVENPEL